MPIIKRLADVPHPARYSHAVVATGKLAFVAGQVALDAEGRLVGAGDLAAQAAQALRNLETVLGELGADWTDVARLNWYVVDVTQIQTIRDVLEEFLRPVLGERTNPASTLVQAAALFRSDVLVEVDAVVALPE
ncbi:RidA family protein [Actinocrinis sp.]|uniref:RidA family protein n=1 Tax=Actinocrinis sp. TaxID=1920516 RepID=UPI002D3A1AF4|nr:RidA family protein [Actinocrinis sp.]HZP53600.1 RidA family protein [Actinocrinis sp.]